VFASVYPRPGWVAAAMGFAMVSGAVMAWLDRSFDTYASWVSWSGSAAVHWRRTVLSVHIVSAAIVSLVFTLGPQWPVVHDPLSALAGALTWLTSSQSLVRARWAPADLSPTDDARSVLEALVRRSVKRRDDGFARAFATVLGDQSSTTTRMRAIETLNAVAALNDEKGTLTTVGSLTEHIHALEGSSHDAKVRALAQVAIRRALVLHGLKLTIFSNENARNEGQAVVRAPESKGAT
jgi:hypothetical protein